MAVAEREQENPLVEGLERLPVPGTSLVIFGATGDLARRKLLPAIYNLAHEGALPERFNLVGDVVERRKQLAARQVAGGAEDRQRRRRHRQALEALDQRVLAEGLGVGLDVYCHA